MALEAERAKRKVGRTFLGDLEKSTLGKGKMQAAGLYSKHLTTGGWRGGGCRLAGLVSGTARTTGGGGEL